MSLGVLQNRETATWQIIEHLQRNGAATIKELEQLLGITTTAVRQHLNNLQADGYIERKAVHAGVGRPHHAYAVTAKAQEIFACHCDDLALTLLEEVFDLEGSEQAGKLLARVGNRLADRYQHSVRSEGLIDRVGELADALYQRGVLTDVQEGDDNTFILHTYNCPYHELAQEHREICEMDKAMLQQVLGTNVNLTNCIMDGHHGCSFVVSQSPTVASKETSVA